ncbi:hypothetical protein M9458_022064, partial [Cirrhinus mrigala]
VSNGRPFQLSSSNPASSSSSSPHQEQFYRTLLLLTLSQTCPPLVWTRSLPAQPR